MKRSIALVSGLALGRAACSADDAPDDNGTAAPAGDEKITLRVATCNEFGYEELLQEYMQLVRWQTFIQKEQWIPDSS